MSNSFKLNAPLLLAIVFLIFVTLSSALNFTPVELTGFYYSLSFTTYLMYVWDKSAAIRGAWRTKESTLHIAALLGGWPGAAFAHKIIRHKSSKTKFRVEFWITTALNISAYIWLHTTAGSLFLSTSLQAIKSTILTIF